MPLPAIDPTALPFLASSYPGLVLSAWGYTDTPVQALAFGPFDTLQGAFDAVAEARSIAEARGLDTDVLLTGIDELGETWDAMQPSDNMSAEEYRYELALDAEEHRQLCAAEARVLYGTY